MRLREVPPHRLVATSHVEKAQECTDTAAWKAVGYGPHEGETSRESRVSSTESGEGPASRGEGGKSLRGASRATPRPAGWTGRDDGTAGAPGRGREVTGWPWSRDLVSYRAADYNRPCHRAVSPISTAF